MAGFFTTTKRRKKSVKAQIRKVQKQIEHKKDKAKLEALKKQLRGY
jgi:hypothetical protein